MLRLLFAKTGNAVWLSHLDLMRLLPRAFRRAGMLLAYSQGFTPHPCLSIALPLSVGVSSICELLDFSLAEGDGTPAVEIAERLNAVLPEGIRALGCYENGRKLKELRWLEAELELEYDNGIPATAMQDISALFKRSELTVEKKGKNGIVSLDILPLLRATSLSQSSSGTLLLQAVVAAQNPTLNPMLLLTAIRSFCPQAAPDFATCRRVALRDEAGGIFR